MATLTLIVFVLTGAIAGLAAGVVLLNVSEQELSYGQGALLGIAADSERYKQGEHISIRAINTGTVPLGDGRSWEFRVAGLSGMLMYNTSWTHVTLEPGEDHILVWNQTKNDQSQALEGLYRISVRGWGPADEMATDTIVITIEK